MYMASVCASCTSFKLNSSIVSDPNNKPQWLNEKDFVTEFIQSVKSFDNKHQTKCDQKVELDLGKAHAHKTVLYWATTPSSSVSIKDAKVAYANFKNHGIVTLDSYGKGLLYLQCPQVYTTKKKGSKKEESFFRHFHYVFANKSKQSWLPTLYTRLIVCKRSLQYVMNELKRNTSVIINALPSEYYAKDHIPNSYNLHYSQVKKMTEKEVHEWMKFVIEKHYPVLYGFLKKGELTIKDVPIICYCAHEKCNASELLEKEFLKKGMHRVDSFPGGMAEFNKQ